MRMNMARQRERKPNRNSYGRGWMMSVANRAIEFEALIIDGQVITIEVQGMKFENEQ